MKISKYRGEDGRLYRLQSAIGQISTYFDRCACEECGSIVVTLMDDVGDVLEVSLSSEDFEEFVQAAIDFDVAQKVRNPKEGHHEWN